jgi:hypothetical protein
VCEGQPRAGQLVATMDDIVEGVEYSIDAVPLDGELALE